MATTYSQLQKQIADLHAQAQRQMQTEITEVVGRVREAIAVYGLTPADLFGKGALQGKSVASKSRSGSTAVLSDAAKYSDGKGGTWVGRGPRPLWLREALAAGRSLDEFAVGATQVGTPSAEAASGDVAPTKKSAVKKGKPAAKKAGQVRFRDGEGNKWSGYGPMPAWLRAAITEGKTVEDFAV